MSGRRKCARLCRRSWLVYVVLLPCGALDVHAVEGIRREGDCICECGQLNVREGEVAVFLLAFEIAHQLPIAEESQILQAARLRPHTAPRIFQHIVLRIPHLAHMACRVDHNVRTAGMSVRSSD